VKKYKNIEEYRADVLTMIHNVVVYHGSLSSIAVKAREMLRECSQCIDDIKCCHFCFKHGNEKVKRYWFCKPCTPPHDLVYAKQDEPPFWWPAKVCALSFLRPFFLGNKYPLEALSKTSEGFPKT
jgi:hypothetical protein